MEERGISDFFIIEKYCDGCKMHKKQLECNYKDSDLYIFWQEENKSYFKKLTKCDGDKIEIADNLFNGYDVKIKKIEDEQVKSYQMNRNTFSGGQETDYSKYYFVIDNQLITKIFDYYALTNKSDMPNINYDFNNSLELIKLDRLCQKIIRKNR